ncbi:WDGH domain-containing protein [Streptococcus suis]|uniref:WDGH domain-containing protein n=1 Tax=Streptococcus suis TaxID=1307 RepID=UPI0009436FE5|nr:hypothetical protein [Streptococcus suis]MDW8739679.1 hypothetical protein [Streptococcus suis]NRG73906.1 hypothetical protein [Streptococcus suis]HEL1905471.1 hypothetical protein [Streptococcus suis]HEL2144163.1 hypothetical protein [Streptococcus suis]HEL2244963.1 hypothetical protein [Streptococcus suis]
MNKRQKKKRLKGDISDGSHTFNELYYHRMVLFLVIMKYNKRLSWKSKKHYDGTMYDDYFIVGINTPKGQFTYHYHIDYWGMFDGIQEIPNAPKWDGHKPDDVTRLFSLVDTNTIIKDYVL